jgi:hypothetical protein
MGLYNVFSLIINSKYESNTFRKKRNALLRNLNKNVKIPIIF